jgi:PAS domain S-box-containing protein
MTEEHLRQVEQEEATVLDSLSEFVLHLDPQLRIIWANRTASEFTGVPSEKMVGRHCYELLRKRRHAPCADCISLKALQTGQTQRGEISTPDGRIWAMRGNLLKDEQGRITGVVEVTRDITERKLAEKKLRESEERYRIVFENTGTAMLICDENTIIQFVNAEFEKLSGYSRVELEEKKSWLDFVAADERERLRQYHEARMKEESTVPRQYEYRFCNRKGEIRNILITVTMIAGTRRNVASLVDITGLKTMERTLALEQDLLHALMESSPDKIYFKDTEGRFIQVNQATARAHDLDDPAKMLGKTDADYFTAEFARGTIENEREIMQTGTPQPQRVEKEVWADGRTVWVSTIKCPLKNKEGKTIGTFGISRDITRQKEDEAALRRRLEFENLLAAVSTDFINLPAQGVDKGLQEALELVGKFANSDRSYIFILSNNGKTITNTHEWCGEGIESHIHRLKDIPIETFPWLLGRLARFEVVRVPRCADLPMEAKAEREEFERESIQSIICIPMVYGGSLIGFLGLDAVRAERKWSGEIVALLKFVGEIFVNALQRKWVEEELSHERNLLRALMDNIPDRIYFKDRESRFIRVNKSLAARHNIPDPTQMLGKTDMDLFTDEHACQALEDEQAVIRTGTPVIGKEEKETSKDGVVTWASTTKMPLRDKDNNIIGTFGLSRDITEKKLAEEAMLHSQKLESLGVLAGGIAHDFNNLLAVVLGNTELALCKLPTDSPVRNFLSQVRIASQRGAELCKQMLSYAGKGFVNMQVLDLNRIVQEVTELLHVSVSKQSSLKYDLKPNLPAVKVDSAQIRQVIMNLVINASEAIGDRKGVIRISTRLTNATRAWLRGSFVETDVPEGEYVCMEVSDTGCGMDEKTLRRIFDPFFSTKFTGRGLGLAAVLGIVQGHQAALKVTSEKGKGSVFQLLIPPATEPAEGASSQKPDDHSWRGEGTVLIVDDESNVLSVTARMLEVFGFKAITASEGSEAIEIYRSKRRDIVMVMLDMTMPQMDGKELSEAISNINPEARILLMSGYSREEANARFQGRRFGGFLQKPFNITDLRSKVQEILAGR